jgi:hypothetical protein
MDIVELKKYFKYEDGKLYKWSKRYSDWREHIPRTINNGYYRVGFGSGRYLMYAHVILWMLYTGKNIPDGMEVDHKNGIRTDNRFDNLRLVTHRENSRNLKIHREGKEVGYTYVKGVNKYKAHIFFGNTLVYLGLYETKDDALAVYNVAVEYADQYVNPTQFCKLLSAFFGFTVGAREVRGYKRRGEGKYDVYLYLDNRDIYLKRVTDEKEAAEFAQLAMKYKAEFVNRQQFLKLLEEKRKSGLDKTLDL